MDVWRRFGCRARANQNHPILPSFKVYLVPVGGGTPVLFGSGAATKTAPDVHGKVAFTTTFSAQLPVGPGDYNAVVYGDDGGELTGDNSFTDLGYSLPDTSNNIYPTLTAGMVRVIKGTPVITWNTPAPITYGTALGVTQL